MWYFQNGMECSGHVLHTSSAYSLLFNREGQGTLFNMNQALGCQFHGLCLTKRLSNVLYHAGSNDCAHIM